MLWFQPSQLQTTTRLLTHSSTVGWGGENLMKSSWIDTRTRRDHSPIMVMGKNQARLGEKKPTKSIFY